MRLKPSSVKNKKHKNSCKSWWWVNDDPNPTSKLLETLRINSSKVSLISHSMRRSKCWQSRRLVSWWLDTRIKSSPLWSKAVKFKHKKPKATGLCFTVLKLRSSNQLSPNPKYRLHLHSRSKFHKRSENHKTVVNTQPTGTSMEWRNDRQRNMLQPK